MYLFSMSGLPKSHKFIFLVIDMSLFANKQTIAFVSLDFAVYPMISLFSGRYLYKKSSAFFTAKMLVSSRQLSRALMTTVSICGQYFKMFSLLFLVYVDSSLDSLSFSSTLGESLSGRLFTIYPSSFLTVPVYSQKVSSSSLSSYWSPFPIFKDKYFNPGTLQLVDLVMAIQMDSMNIYYPRSSFLEIRSKKDVTSLTKGSCI